MEYNTFLRAQLLISQIFLHTFNGDFCKLYRHNQLTGGRIFVSIVQCDHNNMLFDPTDANIFTHVTDFLVHLCKRVICRMECKNKIIFNFIGSYVSDD